MYTDKDKEIILSAGFKDWREVRSKISGSNAKRNANLLRKKHGLEPFCQNTIYVNHDFFKEKTLENSYYAGFISGDGNVSVEQGKSSPRVSIGLDIKDEQFLRSFSEKVGGSISTSVRIDKRWDHPTQEVRWRASSRQMAEDLDKNFNITPRKTFNALPPSGLTAEQELAFIAGVIDADGSYTYQRVRPRLCIVGTEQMLLWINDRLFDGSYPVSPASNIYTINAHADRAILAREKYINMDLPFLERKYRRWESLGLDLEVKSELAV